MKFLKTIALLTIAILSTFSSQFRLPVNAAESSEKYYSLEDSQRHVSDNPVPDEYEDVEFIAASSLVLIAILVGTGRSIKYLDNAGKKNGTKKPL
ncbi:MAG: hypothetical protein ACFBSE_22150 [Prochloraceae cyanobacterium]